MKTTKLRSIKELKGKLKGKRVLLRTDYNIPLRYTKRRAVIVDNYRIKASLDTIKFLLREKAKIVIISHLGRPNGYNKKLSLEPIAKELSRLLKRRIYFYGECIGRGVKEKIKCLNNKDILVLENLRFHKEEGKNNRRFAREIAENFDLFVFDAFSVSHRKHASVVSIPLSLKTYSGFLFEREIKGLSAVSKPKKPFVIILGGVKISTKLGVITKFIKRADYILIGGAMMFTFLKAKNKNALIGRSIYKEEEIKIAKSILRKARAKIILPKDAIISKSISGRKKRVSQSDNIPRDYIGLDIGQKALSSFEDKLKNAKTILWNGPLGYYENKTFRKSTDNIAMFISRLKAKGVNTTVCGGDTLAVINSLKLRRKFSFVSTGGGASLLFLAGEKLAIMKFVKK